MPRKKKDTDKSFIEIIRLLQRSAIDIPSGKISNIDTDLSDIDTRIKNLTKFFEGSRFLKSNEMISFIMYDIEDHRIRRHIARFLLKKGCMRVQKSVFVGRLERKTVREMQEILKEIQAMYENNDSIFFLPAGEENISGMRVIGKNVDFEFAIGNKNTYFI
ncbi:MAG TPA: CRISPR-associated endonuclease Cas2 [Bacteroidales bacterium]|nr:CRISPR-associated endonuclease Cas2 [Bacteroidales bacterium]HPR72992.1 CRISPR-associated endonuclease Cas2 [Bacteroidales bacterium]